MKVLNFIVFCLIIINLISVCVCAYDKFASKKRLRRIPERTLFLLCALGGSISMYFTMQIIRHKTKHKNFMIGIPIIISIQILISYFIIRLI
ncbi:MAG: DUF1294 domain-containing protein [Ruminococcaceae bacterium]|nr:DUF1294 domain-containing protein [Oscillospiraceae bacterium]